MYSVKEMMFEMTTWSTADSPAAEHLSVSIIVNNYNYGHFLRDAIDSALNQTYANTEIIVVDDGSTDNSRDVIASYGDRVIPLLKENGGQASAFNVGFARSQGDIVFFLDSDDMLLPHIAGEVVNAFQANPCTARVQFRLEHVDADGQPTGEHTPASELPMPTGDLRKHTLLFPDDIRTPPTSGNAFAASVLRQILPMPLPDAVYGRTGADLYLHNLVPLFGPVKSLRSIGGRYRTHENNEQYTSSLNLGHIRRTIVRSFINHEHICSYANLLQLPDVPRDSSKIMSVTFLANRMASLRLEPESHPVKSDSRLSLLKLGAVISFRRFDVRLQTRLFFTLWFVIASSCPRPLVKWLVVRAFYPEQRGALGRLVG